MTSTTHQWLRDHAWTRWACVVTRCDTDDPPQACVLLLGSVVMTLAAVVVTIVGW